VGSSTKKPEKDQRKVWENPRHCVVGAKQKGTLRDELARAIGVSKRNGEAVRKPQLDVAQKKKKREKKKCGYRGGEKEEQRGETGGRRGVCGRKGKRNIKGLRKEGEPETAGRAKMGQKQTIKEIIGATATHQREPKDQNA